MSVKEINKIQNQIRKDDKDPGNYYIVKKETDYATQPRRYYRISQFANSFQSSDRFNGWYKHLAIKQDPENKQLSEEELLKIGEKEGNKKKNSQAKKGTQKHKHIEEFFKKRDKYSSKEWVQLLENFAPFVNLFNPYVLEKKIFYETTLNKFLQNIPNGKLLGLAGTFDGLGAVDGNGLSFEKNGEPMLNGSFDSVIDWKYPSNPKYPIKKMKGRYFYPLIVYGIQLSCYIASINQHTGLGINKGIVVVAPENSQTCYPYYFSPKAIGWLWENAKKMMVALAYGEKKEFDYTHFEQETYRRGFHGRRLYIR